MARLGGHWEPVWGAQHAAWSAPSAPLRRASALWAGFQDLTHESSGSFTSAKRFSLCKFEHVFTKIHARGKRPGDALLPSFQSFLSRNCSLACPASLLSSALALSDSAENITIARRPFFACQSAGCARPTDRHLLHASGQQRCASPQVPTNEASLAAGARRADAHRGVFLG